MLTDRRSRAADTPGTTLAALVLVALALRPQLSGVGPLSGRIIADLGVSHAFVGLLTTIPVLCMGLFAPVGPAVAARLGARWAIAAAAGLVALAGILRAVVPGEAAIVAVTFVIGFGTAIAGPMLAMFVRGAMPEYRVAGTSAYAGGITLGQAISLGIVVPVAIVLGGWRASFAFVSALSGLGVIAWVMLTAAEDPATREAERAASSWPRLPVRRPVVWALGLLFGVQSAVFYGTSAWLPSFYVERGWDPSAAAGLLSVSGFSGLAAIVFAPVAARRGVERREMLAGAAASVAIAISGVVLFPSLAWGWAVLLGVGISMMFTTVLTLPTDVAHDARGAGGASALMLLVGYLIASVAPFALGAVRDATGSFTLSLWVLLVLAVSMLPLAWALSPERLRPAVRAAS